MSSFLSPDNYVQDPTSQQGFNRYAYCVYNPLKYVDPTGERYFGPWLPDITAAIEREARQRCFHEQYRMNEEIEFMNMMCKLGMLEFSWGDDKLEGGGTHDNSGPKNGDGTPMQADDQTPTANGDGDETQNKDGKTPETAMNAENLFFTCYVNYMFGNNQDIYVDASSMSEKLSGLNIEEDFENLGNGEYSINLFDHFSECPDLALALGSITLSCAGDNMYEIYTDTYDFDIRHDDGLTKRNIATFLGGLVHGTFMGKYHVPDGPFNIHFEGKIHINPRP